MSNPNVLTGPTSPISVPNIPAGILMGNIGGIPSLDSALAALNTTLIPLLLAMIASQKYFPNTKHSFKKEYDYVIVGAGAAGSVLANRLSECENVDVLILEAGKPPPIMTEIPGIARGMLITDCNWNYLSEPQNFTAAQLFERRIPFPAGKAVGGSSVVNAMLFMRGNHHDYDEWEKMGAKDWRWEKVYPYFLKLENNTDPDIANNGYHHVGGPMTASRVRYTPEINPRILEGIKSLGFETVDPNGATQLGVSDYQAFIRNGQRCSTAKAYLVPVDDRPNLDIVSEAFVKKIRIRCKKAEGVYFDHSGKTHYVKAKREVILSAGAINTPQLLMLSGVGPRETLEKFKIPVKADLPVGENLQDHVTAVLFASVAPPVAPYLEKLLNPLNIIEYATNRTGPLASSCGVFVCGYFRSDDAATPEGVPNYELYFVEGVNLDAQLSFGLKPLVSAQLLLPYQLSPMVWCLSSIMHPKSVGYVSIRSSNPYDAPIIQPSFLEHPQDVKDIVAGLKSCRKILNTPAVQKAGVKEIETLMPGCEDFADNEDKYLECYVRAFTWTISHQSCTAKMGDPNDPTTVVDPELRVKGIRKLRVVDASIMPKVISGNTNIPTVMIAEKAADMIKKTICSCSKSSKHLEEVDTPP